MGPRLSCRKCGERITVEVEKCPRCAYPTKHGQAMVVSRALTKRRLYYLLAGVGVFVLIWIIWKNS